MIPFCIVIPADYDTMLNKPAIELALSEVAAARGMTAQVLYINSGYGVSMWRWNPWQPMRILKAQGLCQVAIVAGIGGFAGAYIDEGYAVLGGWTLWALSWGEDAIMPRTWVTEYGFPWGIYLNRRSQMGAVLEEYEHLILHDGRHEERPGYIPWEKRFW